jgi:hypothetical protein
VLTQAVAADPEVAALLNERHIETEVVPADLGGPTHVIRVRLEAGEVVGGADSQGLILTPSSTGPAASPSSG